MKDVGHEYCNLMFRLPFTPYYVAKYRGMFLFRLMVKVWNGDGYFWRLI